MSGVRGYGRLTAVAASLLLTACSSGDWRTASRESAGIAPLVSEVAEPIVLVYAARTVGWRGWFSVHTWIAVKPGAGEYEVIDVTGFRGRRNGGRFLAMRADVPDRRWFGAEPTLLQELRGDAAVRAIPRILAAVEEYPYATTYRVYPGPNSNTFVSYVLRRVPELTVELPPNAIGKDWLEGGGVVDRTESGTGGQFNLLGLLGVAGGLAEGLEANVLGLVFGIDLWSPALKLPLVGRVGFPDRPFVE